MRFHSCPSAFGLAIGLVSTAVVAGPEPGRTDQLLVKFDSNFVNGASEARRLGESLGKELKYVRETPTGRVLFALPEKASNRAVEKFAEAIQRMPGVSYAEADINLVAFSTNDPYREQYQWHYKGPNQGQPGGLNVESVWGALDTTYTEVVVAVLDTGITPHPDLDANVIAGYDMISDPNRAKDGDGRDTDPTDQGDSTDPTRRSSWHGTHVAGTVAAVNDNGLGMAGVGGNRVKVMPVRVLGVGGGSYADIGDAILWSAQQGARVINMSLGGQSSCSPGSYMQEAINTAVSAGVTVVVSAGNSNADTVNFTPASCQNVINVAAGNAAGGRSYYSNYGELVDLMAPGGGNGGAVWSMYNLGYDSIGEPSYGGMNGTSMAAPHVAGLAALALTEANNLSPIEVESLLKAQVRAFPASCLGCGTGLADAAQVMSSLDSSSSTPVPPEEPVLDAPLAPGFLNYNLSGGTSLTLSWGASSSADLYELEYSIKLKGRKWGDFQVIDKAISDTSFSHDPGEGTFRYRVRATNSAGISAWTESPNISISNTETESGTGSTKCHPKRGCQ